MEITYLGEIEGIYAEGNSVQECLKKLERETYPMFRGIKLTTSTFNGTEIKAANILNEKEEIVGSIIKREI
jgi:hypothetical protein